MNLSLNDSVNSSSNDSVNFSQNSLSRFEIKGENPHKINAVYASAEFIKAHFAVNLSENSTRNLGENSVPNSALNPAKIDYLIFLDSDDFWEENCLKECVLQVKNCPQIPDVVWFNWKYFYDFGDKINEIPQWIYEQEKYEDYLIKFDLKKPTFLAHGDWIKICQQRNITFFTTPWDKFIRFKHLQDIKLRYKNGIMMEDALFAILLFVQSSIYAILQKRLIVYRIRPNSTITFNKTQKEFPLYLQKAFSCFEDANYAWWGYWINYCWLVNALELIKWCDNYKDKSYAQMVKKQFLPHFLKNKNVFVFFDTPQDPFLAKPKLVKIIKKFGRKSIYLPKMSRLQFLQYSYPKIYTLYQMLGEINKPFRNLERKFRLWRKNKFNCKF